MTPGEALAGRAPVLLHGAVGTELARRGVDTSPPLWSGRALAFCSRFIRACSTFIRSVPTLMTEWVTRTSSPPGGAVGGGTSCSSRRPS